MKKNNEKGFTLIEIIIVVMIMSLIATLVVPQLFKKVESSKKKIAKTQIILLENAFKMFKLDTGRYPSSEEGFKILMNNTGNISNWDGPYLEKGIPKDPWDKEYHYVYPGKNYIFEIYSFGADGKKGGDGENIDINNYSVGTK